MTNDQEHAMSDRDEELRQAEQRGARAALTRLAEDIRVGWNVTTRTTSEEIARSVGWWRDQKYPAPRVRAVVNGEVGTTWTLRNDCWQASHFGALPRRSEVSAMYALQQRADAEGFVVEGEGLGAAAPNSERGAGEASSASAAAPTIQSHSPAPTPAAREWWLCVEPSGGAYVEQALRDAKNLQERDDEIVHVREVRPLTAAQVEALEVAMATAWYGALGYNGEGLQAQVERRRMNSGSKAWRAQTRAALTALGIPYEEA